MLARSLVVVDRGGNFMRRVSRDAAYALVQRGGAVFRPKENGRIRAVQLLRPDDHVYEECRPRRTRYSHDRETETNPHGCWTLITISPKDRPVFRQVVEECLQAAA